MVTHASARDSADERGQLSRAPDSRLLVRWVGARLIWRRQSTDSIGCIGKTRTQIASTTSCKNRNRMLGAFPKELTNANLYHFICIKLHQQNGKMKSSWCPFELSGRSIWERYAYVGRKVNMCNGSLEADWGKRRSRLTRVEVVKTSNYLSNSIFLPSHMMLFMWHMEMWPFF